MRFAILNEASDPALSVTALTKIANALQAQTVEFGLWWEATPSTVEVIEKGGSIPTLDTLFHIKDNIPEAPDALAYHTMDNHGRPVLVLGWETIKQNGGTIATGPNSLSTAMSHELLETIQDPYVNTWNDCPDGVREQSTEVCDPVQGGSYEIDGVAVSDFVGPRYFDSSPNAPGPYSRLGSVTPFEVARDGYAVYRKGGPAGKISQVFGDMVTDVKKDQVVRFGRRGSFVGKTVEPTA
jgi:hypothetical protein